MAEEIQETPIVGKKEILFSDRINTALKLSQSDLMSGKAPPEYPVKPGTRVEKIGAILKEIEQTEMQTSLVQAALSAGEGLKNASEAVSVDKVDHASVAPSSKHGPDDKGMTR